MFSLSYSLLLVSIFTLLSPLSLVISFILSIFFLNDKPLLTPNLFITSSIHLFVFLSSIFLTHSVVLSTYHLLYLSLSLVSLLSLLNCFMLPFAVFFFLLSLPSLFVISNESLAQSLYYFIPSSISISFFYLPLFNLLSISWLDLFVLLNHSINIISTISFNKMGCLFIITAKYNIQPAIFFI